MAFSHLKEKYGLLPEVRVEEVRELEKEVSEFSEICHVAPEKAKWIVESEVEWLENNKGFLGRLVETGVDSALNLLSDKLEEPDLKEVRTYLLKGVLLVLQGINLALKRASEIK